MLDIKTGWDQPYRVVQGDHAAAFKIEMKPSQNSGNIPVHLHILLDISGSMNAGNKLNEAKKTCCFIIDQLGEEDTLAVSGFNDYVNVVTKAGTMTAERKKAARDAVGQLQAAGVTVLDKALDHILDAIGPKVQRPTFVILISDGRPTDAKGAGVSELTPYFESANRIGKSGAKVISVALGNPGAYEADFFDAVAQQTGGPFRFSPRASDLRNVLAEDIRVIQAIGAQEVFIDFSFSKTGTELLWFGRAFPDKQFFESIGNTPRYSLGTLSHDQPWTYIAYILTGGDIETASGRQKVGDATITCQGPSGPWTGKCGIEMEYTDDPELLGFIDQGVRRWKLELEETDQTMKAVKARKNGNEGAFERHMDAAKKTRSELGKSTDNLDKFRKTKKGEDMSALGDLLKSARASRRPQ